MLVAGLNRAKPDPGAISSSLRLPPRPFSNLSSASPVSVSRPFDTSTSMDRPDLDVPGKSLQRESANLVVGVAVVLVEAHLELVHHVEDTLATAGVADRSPARGEATDRAAERHGVDLL